MSNEPQAARTFRKPVPALLTTDEAAYLLRCTRDHVRDMIHRRDLKAFSCPMRIPVRELLRYGITLEDAERLLNARDPATTSTGP